MASLANCWEVMDCGREPGGAREKELGTCPAATDRGYHGINGGINAGRACWFVAGTLCEGTVQGSFAEKFRDCFGCQFYRRVKRESAS